VAPDGSSVVGGMFHGAIDFAGTTLTSMGDADIFLVALQPDGTVRHAERFGDAGRDELFDIALDAAGQTIIAGSFEGTIDFGSGPLLANGLPDMFLAKLSF
jgi:hypothetical protein